MEGHKGDGHSVQDIVVKNFPGTIMHEYLKRYTGNASGWDEAVSVRLKVLDGVLRERCRRDDPRLSLTGEGQDCLMSIRTGDVVARYCRRGAFNTVHLPASPAAVAQAAKHAQCRKTLFVTGKHHGHHQFACGDNETAAYLGDLRKHMGGRSHTIAIAENDAARDADDDMCLLAS